jgi:phosphatidate phosphatase LPIN
MDLFTHFIKTHLFFKSSWSPHYQPKKGRNFSEMSYLLGLAYKLYDSYKEINPATLNGAIDVLVVKQEDGTYRSSPFHVRFGKFGVFKSCDNVIDIEINGESVPDLHMQLGEAGEAFFVELSNDGNDKDMNYDSDTSATPGELIADKSSVIEPIIKQEPTVIVVDYHQSTDDLIDESNEIINKRNPSNSIEFGNVIVTDCTNIINLPPIAQKDSLIQNKLSVPISVNYYSDGENDVTPEPTSPINSRPHTPKSDSETVEVVAKMNTEWNWNWGELPEKTINQTTTILINEDSPISSKKAVSGEIKPTDGVYLHDTDKLDSEMAELYINGNQKNCPSKPSAIRQLLLKDEDQESGSGQSTPHSPIQSNMLINDIQVSLCGGLQQHQQDNYEELFQQHVVSFDKFQEEISTIIANQNLVVKLNGRYFNWSTAGPIILSALVFQKPISNESVSQLVEVNMPKPQKVNKTEQQQKKKSWFFFNKNPTTETATKSEDLIKKPIPINLSSPTPSPPPSTQSSKQQQSKQRRRIKSTRLSSEHIKKLNLKPGANQITYSITTAIQGTTKIESFIFLWNYDDKIVVSDIDGTITKSDVLGHFLPMFGKDWSQRGITDLFSAIDRNSYKFMYLSARAIGQSKVTRDYLRSINQDGLTLPDGPLFVTPASLFKAFHKEVIERKPQEFKISCLEDIKFLFPVDRNPFYAGYGNRVNDVISYKTVGIPLSRIFTINPSGELKHEVSQTFQSSYSKLCDYVDQIFPPIKPSLNQTEYSSYTYWKDPLPVLELEDEILPTPKKSTSQTSSPAKPIIKKADSKKPTAANKVVETTRMQTKSSSSTSIDNPTTTPTKPVQIQATATTASSNTTIEVEIFSKSL